jgi:hypothetical protein
MSLPSPTAIWTESPTSRVARPATRLILMQTGPDEVALRPANAGLGAAAGSLVINEAGEFVPRLGDFSGVGRAALVDGNVILY